MLTTVLQTIGNTPMLRLDLSRDLPGTVWLKLENRNPRGLHQGPRGLLPD